MSEAIYVEITIDAGVSQIWDATQVPEVHRRWDLRFSDIDYVGSPADGVQKFLYTRRVLPGLVVRGWGETSGESQSADGSAASALRFGSDQRRSLIRAGSGYWRYIPSDQGVRFLTRYDYSVRWGVFGRILDRAFFRRAIGWATAYSFDSMRLMVELGVEPRGPVGALPRRLMRRIAPRASRCLRQAP